MIYISQSQECNTIKGNGSATLRYVGDGSAANIVIRFGDTTREVTFPIYRNIKYGSFNTIKATPTATVIFKGSPTAETIIRYDNSVTADLMLVMKSKSTHETFTLQVEDFTDTKTWVRFNVTGEYPTGEFDYVILNGNDMISDGILVCLKDNCDNKKHETSTINKVYERECERRLQ